MSKNLRTELAKAKGLGSAKSGSHHWLHQRLTALIILPLCFWLIFFIKSTVGSDVSTFITAIQNPYNIAPICILVVALFYHAMLGMRVVIEDYVSCMRIRVSLIILLQLFVIFTVVSFIVAIFYIIATH